MRSRWFLVMLLTVFSIAVLNAAWLDNVPNQLTQPDGTVIDVLYSGDEFHNWAHDSAGHTMIRDIATGYICWARSQGGDLVSTGYPVHLHTPQSLGIVPHENISEARYLEKRAEWGLDYNTRTHRTPSIGTIQNLVVFIRFLGEEEFTRPITFYDNMFNAQGTGVNSLYQYFWDASYNQLEVYSPFFPLPHDTTILSYESPNPRSFYQPFSASNPHGYQGWMQRTSREHQLLAAAIAYIEHQVPIDLVIDSNNNGRVDNVCFVIKGGTGDWADLLWPHRWTLHSVVANIHGKRVWDYNFNIENHMNVSGVSVLAHELAHSLGAPDFYRYNNNGTPTDIWCLMARNLNPPQSITAHVKEKYLNWITIPEISSTGSYYLHPNSVSQNNSYKVMSPNSTVEYFVLEYRSNLTGIIDQNIGGSGLLAWRVNPTISGNSEGPPDELYVYRPGGTPTNNGSVGAALLGAHLGRPGINDFTNPNSFLSNGQPGGLNVHSIAIDGETITFVVDIGGPDPDDFDESFENNAMNNHDWRVDPVNPWFITTEAASDGTHSIRSPALQAGQRSRLQIDLHHGSGFLQFWVRTNTQSSGNSLVFLINGMERRRWSGNTPWTHVVIPVSAGINNFAWDYLCQSGGSGTNVVYIDQIGFPPITGHILYPPHSLEVTHEDRDVLLIWQPPFQTTVPDPPALLGYHVFQSSIRINDDIVPTPTFTSAGSTGGRLSYTVNAVYQTGVSASTDAVPYELEVAIPQSLRVVSTPEGIKLDWDFPFDPRFLHSTRIYRNGNNIIASVLRGTYTYIDNDLIDNTTYTYYLRAIYSNPTAISGNSESVSIEYTGTMDETQSVATQLMGNYPNPFNPETKIEFFIREAGHVSLYIYNVKGQAVRTLVDAEMSGGSHFIHWDGKDDAGNIMASGIYFYRMQASDYHDAKKMILLK